MANRAYSVNADSWTVLLDILRNDVEFNNDLASLRGRKQSYGAGRMTNPERRAFLESAVSYVIYSYETPIAWRTQDGAWHVPDTRYSVTTSKHQGKVRTALQVLRNGATAGMWPPVKPSAVLHRGEAVRDWHNDPKTHSYA